jgi:hypothetical protein
VQVAAEQALMSASSSASGLFCDIISAYGYAEASYGEYNGPSRAKGKQNAPPGAYNSWLNWLRENAGNYGDYDSETNTYTYDYDDVWNAYVDWYYSIYGCNPGEYTGADVEVTWEQWLAWFMSHGGSHDDGTNNHNFVSLDDYFALLWMVVIYGVYVAIRRRKLGL